MVGQYIGEISMSKRMRELAEQAGYYIDPDFDIEFEVFAELIVRECMYVGRLSQINNGLVDSDIKEHFGVEE